MVLAIAVTVMVASVVEVTHPEFLLDTSLGGAACGHSVHLQSMLYCKDFVLGKSCHVYLLKLRCSLIKMVDTTIFWDKQVKDYYIF